MQEIVFYHNDLDGFASAWVYWKYSGVKDAEYRQISHTDTIEEIYDTKLKFLDFCPKPVVIDRLLDAGNELLIIDHHKTSESYIHLYMDNPSVTIHHDTYYSGCVLTWIILNHCGGYDVDGDIPKGLIYIQDRDLWKFNYEETKAFCVFVDSIPREFDEWNEFMINGIFMQQAISSGKAILEYQQKLVKVMAKGAFVSEGAWRPAFGYKVAIANVSTLSSEVCHQVLENHPEVDFVATYSFYRNRKTWQLRSKGDFDVSEIAKKNGGGGHKNAAGFVEK